jgi:hypothetical protein
VYELTMPSSHMMTRITKMVHSMASSSWPDIGAHQATPLSAARTAMQAPCRTEGGVPW